MARNGNLSNDQPFMRVRVITPSDVTTYSPPLDAILVNGAGNLAIVDLSGNTVTIAGVVAGSLLPIGASRVMSTNTTATNIIGLNW
jgi:hypothetical protein